MQAIGALTFLTIEMSMLIIVLVMILAGAQFVTKCTTAIFNGMYEMMLQEDGEGAEDSAPFGSGHLLLQFLQRKRAQAPFQFLVDKKSHGRGFHASLFQPLLCILFHQQSDLIFK